MRSLFLTVTLLGLVAVLQAQDDLPFLSEENKVRQGGMWTGVCGKFDCWPVLETRGSTREGFSSLSLSAQVSWSTELEL